MTTLLDIWNQKSDQEKAELKERFDAMHDQSISLHNAAVLGIIPSYNQIDGHDGQLIKASQ